MGDLVHGGHRTPLASGRTLFDHADELAMVVPDTCRRTGRCRECVVEIRGGGPALSSPTEAEGYLRPPFRLACQARIEDDSVDVEIAVLRRRLQIVSAPGGEAALARPAELDPAVRREGDRVLRGAVDVDAYRGALLGVAIDAGTTTVVLEVIDLETGAALHRTAIENPQRFGGSDVISRIEYEVAVDPGELRRALRRALDHELKAAYRELGVDRRTVHEVVLVGNPTMRDLALGLDVRSIGARPFRSVAETAWLAGLRRSTAVTRRGHEVGLFVNPAAVVYGGPLIGSHVGADIAADVAAVDMEGGPGVSMLIDIGTNSELVVRAGDRWLAASCPAGPAFEGGLISYGMQAVEGAIQSVRLVSDGFAWRTIGDVDPLGLCGSGLIDLLAELRRGDRMTPGGRLADGTSEVVVAPEVGVHLTRQDVSLLAQAKAANSCGQGILMERLGIRASDIDRLWLAGGFATYVDVPNAIAIGLLPRVAEERIVKVGNASLAGAVRLLRSVTARRSLESLAERIEHVELELDPTFFDRFVDGCRWEPQPLEVMA
jgi:uncharacterized 2Fe-2S/4Fe-4S cluster protein (DUF4445 family)